MKEILKGHIIHAPALGELNIMENGYMVLCDGIIEGIYDQLPAAHRDGVLHDYGDKLIMQSFADMHLHAPQYPMLGMGMDLPLLDWLSTYTFPTEARFADTAYAREIYESLAKEGIAVRCFENGLRICAGNRREQTLLMNALEHILQPIG